MISKQRVRGTATLASLGSARLKDCLREGSLKKVDSFPHGLVLATEDQEEAASWLSDVAVPYASELLPGSPPFSTQIFMVEGQRLGLSRVVTKGAMRIKSWLPKDSYALIFYLRKDVGLHTWKEQTVPVGPDFGFVHSAGQPVEVRTPQSFEALFLRISRAAVREELKKLLEREVLKELIFLPELRLASGAGRGVRDLCDDLRRKLYSTDKAHIQDSVELRDVESRLITLLLQAQPHNYRRLLNRRSEAGTWQIRAAEEFMSANAHMPISLGDVCRAAGVNARTLQDSFQKRRGNTPMAFLRRVRMDEVRSALLQPEEKTSVSGEAARWGFLHFGRFSRDYKIRFGELPSETLRRTKGIQQRADD